MVIKKELLKVIEDNKDKKIIFEIKLNISICKALILFLYHNNIMDNYRAWQEDLRNNNLISYSLYINKGEKSLYKRGISNKIDDEIEYKKYLKELSCDFIIIDMEKYSEKGNKKKLKI